MVREKPGGDDDMIFSVELLLYWQAKEGTCPVFGGLLVTCTQYLILFVLEREAGAIRYSAGIFGEKNLNMEV